MAGRSYRSISGPIVLGSISVVLSVVLLAGWIFVIVQNLQLTQRVVENTWLLVAGILSLIVIITVLLLFSVFLVREILEGRRQSGFIDSVTHELKSPLASLSLGLQTLERARLDHQDAADVRKRMRGDVERLRLFIDDVLDASRVEHGEVAQAVAEFDLKTVVERSADAVARRFNVAADTITIDIAGPLTLRTDQTAVDTVVRNLLDNAVKYSDGVPSVRFSASRKDGDLVLEVRDKGIGIPPASQKRIFERFYRAPNEAVRRRSGTGLGLYVVHALVRRIGGRLSVTSEGRGCGTVIHAILPWHRVSAGGSS